MAGLDACLLVGRFGTEDEQYEPLGRGGTLPPPERCLVLAIYAFPLKRTVDLYQPNFQGPGRPRAAGKVSQLSAGVQRRLRRRGTLRSPVVEKGPAMVLAEAERVAGRHLGTAVRRPRRPALGPATPVSGPAGVPVRLVGKTSTPSAQARVFSGPAAIWSTTRADWPSLPPVSGEANDTGRR